MKYNYRWPCLLQSMLFTMKVHCSIYHNNEVIPPENIMVFTQQSKDITISEFENHCFKITTYGNTYICVCEYGKTNE